MENKQYLCPCCRSREYPLDIDVPENCDVNFDIRKYTHIVFCRNCNRRIKYSFVKTTAAAKKK